MDEFKQEQEMVNAFIQEAEKLVPGLSVIFAELLKDGTVETLSVCLDLPSGVGPVSDKAYRLHTLAATVAAESDKGFVVTFFPERNGAFVPLDLPYRLRSPSADMYEKLEQERLFKERQYQERVGARKTLDTNVPFYKNPTFLSQGLQVLTVLLLAAVLFFLISENFREKRMQSWQGQDVRSAVVTTRDVAKGSTYTADILRTKQMHESWLPAGALSDVSQAIGKRASEKILTGQILTEFDLDPLPEKLQKRLMRLKESDRHLIKPEHLYYMEGSSGGDVPELNGPATGTDHFYTESASPKGK